MLHILLLACNLFDDQCILYPRLNLASGEQSGIACRVMSDLSPLPPLLLLEVSPPPPPVDDGGAAVGVPKVNPIIVDVVVAALVY